MRCADLALYSGKEAGRGGHAFFKQQMYVDAEDYRSLENDVRNALGSDGLALHYQPIIDARSGRLVGREALLRWSHPTRGPIPPDQFVPIIEDAGLIHQIGDWVIREACAEAMRWPGDLRVAVNISAAQLSGSGIAETVLGALAATGLAPGRLELEVTESIFIGDDISTLAALERLRAIGVRLVLDDFGKGYSSFGYLSRAQFSKIKIDRSFVAGAAEGRARLQRHRPRHPCPGPRPQRRDYGRGRRERARGGGDARAGLRPAAGLFVRASGSRRGIEPPTGLGRRRRPFLAPRGRYKPPLPRDFAAHRLLGRRQVVRHRFLVPAFAGSNPAAPASLRLLKSRSLSASVPSRMPGRLRGLRTPPRSGWAWARSVRGDDAGRPWRRADPGRAVRG